MNSEKLSHFPTSEKIHTDILEEKYGMIHSRVLRHDDVFRQEGYGEDSIREVLMLDENNITRTHAMTFLTFDKENKEISEIDRMIMEGGLIGKTFRDYGYTIKKNVLDVFMIEIPIWLKKAFADDNDSAKSRITEFYAKKGAESPQIYGIVLEIYCPDFKDPNEGINNFDLEQINPMTGSLQSAGIPSHVIWDSLDHSENKEFWKERLSQYELAKEMSNFAITTLHQKILFELNKKHII